MKTVIEMAREVAGDDWTLFRDFLPEIHRLADLVRADEREACAKVCDDIDAEYEGEDVLATWCSQAIRARGNT